MASIRLTKEIRDKIVYNLRYSYADLIDKAEKSIPETFDLECANYFIEKEINPYKQDMPAHWLKEASGFDLDIRNAKRTTLYNSEFRLPIPMQCPSIRGLIGTSYMSGIEFSIKIPDDYIFPDHIMETAQDYYDRRNSADNERNSAVKHIKQLLANCNTVKQFITLWPKGIELLDWDTKEAYEQASQPRARRAPDPEREAEIKAIQGNLNAGLLRKKMYDNT